MRGVRFAGGAVLGAAMGCSGAEFAATDVDASDAGSVEGHAPTMLAPPPEEDATTRPDVAVVPDSSSDSASQDACQPVARSVACALCTPSTQCDCWAPDDCGGKYHCSSCDGGRDDANLVDSFRLDDSSRDAPSTVDVSDAGADVDGPPCVPHGCGTGQCGTVDNGCGGTLGCGPCAPPMSCGLSHLCSCVPNAGACAGRQCGMVPDGCGGITDCGSCSGVQVCDSSFTCCTPHACSVGSNCGSAPDGCGGVATCGPASCSGTDTCGGGGVPNVCGCTPRTCAQQGIDCGVSTDACGNAIDCGACPSWETCGVERPNLCPNSGCSLEQDTLCVGSTPTAVGCPLAYAPPAPCWQAGTRGAIADWCCP